MVMCEPTSLLITRCVSRVLRMLFLKSSQFIPCPETAFSSSSMLGSLFSVRMASSLLMSSGSTLTPMSLARCTRRDWSTRSRSVFFWRSSMAICNCSGVQRFWHSDLASSSAVWRALSYSERVMISLLTRSEYDKARQTADEDAKSECQNRCTPEQLQIAIEDRQKNTLRDLVDQSLLVQRAKDMGVSVEPELIKSLEAIRTENKLPSMEELEKAVSGQGMNWEDFKNNIRNTLLTQRVISSEVGSHITISDEEVTKYYEAHKAEFVRPEQVALREIVVSTEGKKPEDLPDLKKKAETALKRVQDGEDFGEIAKRFSDGSTKSQGGFLGVYKRGELSKELEDVVFKMKRNDLTDIMETKQGFLILQVLEHYDEGEQSLAKVKNEIMDKLYSERMEPAMREYLKTLREQSYVVIKPGIQDIAGSGSSEIQEASD